MPSAYEATLLEDTAMPGEWPWCLPSLQTDRNFAADKRNVMGGMAVKLKFRAVKGWTAAKPYSDFEHALRCQPIRN